MIGLNSDHLTKLETPDKEKAKASPYLESPNNNQTGIAESVSGNSIVASETIHQDNNYYILDNNKLSIQIERPCLNAANTWLPLRLLRWFFPEYPAPNPFLPG